MNLFGIALGDRICPKCGLKLVAKFCLSPRYCSNEECIHSLAFQWMDVSDTKLIRRIKKFFNGIKCYIKNRFIDRIHIVRLGLKPGRWCDADERMLLAMMSLLVEFVEKEAEFTNLAMEADVESGYYGFPITDEIRADSEKQASQAKEILEIYRWWKNYPSRIEEIKKSVHPCTGSLEEDIGNINRSSILSRVLTSHSWALEDKLNVETRDMLHRLVEIRGKLWT